MIDREDVMIFAGLLAAAGGVMIVLKPTPAVYVLLSVLQTVVYLGVQVFISTKWKWARLPRYLAVDLTAWLLVCGTWIVLR